jgi:hypothetical protein
MGLVGRLGETALDDSPRPDRVELVVRFLCGSILGLAFGLYVAVSTPLSTATEFVIALCVTTCGLLALRYGDRFWFALRHLKWLWP